MNERRKLLLGLSGAAGFVAVGGSADAALVSDGRNLPLCRPSLSRDLLHGKSQFPEVMVDTQDGQKVRLYADLIKGKVVTVNFMCVDNETNFPITGRLLQTARLLGGRLGKDVHMISITSDTDHDTPERLRSFAKHMGVPQGWHFVRTSAASNAMVAARLYRHGYRPHPSAKLDLVHYGNDAVGLWAAFPSTVQPEDAAMRVRSVMNGARPSGPAKQAGPRKLGEPGPAFNNRVASA